MSLNHGTRIIADAKVAGISGKKGVGFYQLGISIEFSTAPRQASEPELTLRNIGARVYVGNSPRNLAPLGCAIPESPIQIQPKLHADRDFLLFDVDLSPSQIAELEQIRNGGELYFGIQLFAESFGPHGSMLARDDLQYRATLSDWAAILRTMKYADILVLGIELPTVITNGKIESGVELVRQAQSDLLAGRFDAVVGKCRMAIESVRSELDDEASVHACLQKFRENKTTMTKFERELFVSEAIRHYAHLAHHVNDDGAPTWYSRSDATFLLVTTASFVASAVSRAQISKAGHLAK